MPSIGVNGGDMMKLPTHADAINCPFCGQSPKKSIVELPSMLPQEKQGEYSYSCKCGKVTTNTETALVMKWNYEKLLRFYKFTSEPSVFKCEKHLQAKIIVSAPCHQFTKTGDSEFWTVFCAECPNPEHNSVYGSTKNDAIQIWNRIQNAHAHIRQQEFLNNIDLKKLKRRVKNEIKRRIAATKTAKQKTELACHYAAEANKLKEDIRNLQDEKVELHLYAENMKSTAQCIDRAFLQNNKEVESLRKQIDEQNSQFLCITRDLEATEENLVKAESKIGALEVKNHHLELENQEMHKKITEIKKWVHASPFLIPKSNPNRATIFENLVAATGNSLTRPGAGTGGRGGAAEGNDRREPEQDNAPTERSEEAPKGPLGGLSAEVRSGSPDHSADVTQGTKFNVFTNVDCRRLISGEQLESIAQNQAFSCGHGKHYFSNATTHASLGGFTCKKCGMIESCSHTKRRLILAGDIFCPDCNLIITEEKL